jgi:hypothetical protein
MGLPQWSVLTWRTLLSSAALPQPLFALTLLFESPLEVALALALPLSFKLALAFSITPPIFRTPLIVAALLVQSSLTLGAH